MAKVITARRQEGELEKAHDYIRTFVLFPSSLLGLLFLVGGVGVLIYQLIVGAYSLQSFVHSSGLLVTGILLGWMQTVYHKFIMREHPSYFAGRMKSYAQRGTARSKKQVAVASLEHKGRSLVPFLYVVGGGLLIGLSSLSFITGTLYAGAAFAFPWAGFFWAKMFFWKGLVRPPGKKPKKG